MGQSQLVCNFRNNSDDDRRGFRLPCDLSPEQMSILVKPGKFSDRAVISVAGNLLGVGQFSILQLQVCEGDGNDMGDRILAIDAVQGTIPLTTSPCDCIFLAFCSYQFDLLNRNGKFAARKALCNSLKDFPSSLISFSRPRKSYIVEVLQLWGYFITTELLYLGWQFILKMLCNAPKLLN